MLFDLQSKGRRTAVKIIYLGLAILIGGGLVLFGIGTSGGGGLLDVFSDQSQDISSQVSNAEKRAQRAVRLNPRDAEAWAVLARTRYQRAGQGDNFNESAGTFTEQGQEQLRSAAAAWDRYLALNPPRLDANVARLMAIAFGETGLNQPAEAARALEIVTEEDPSSAAFSNLASYAWLAGQQRKGDLAAAEAVRLAPEAQQRTLRRQLDRINQEIQRQAIQEAIDSGALRTSTTR